jgi:hypothetical protein
MVLAVLLVPFTRPLLATHPPRPGQTWPDSYRQFTQANRQVLSTRGFVPLVRRIQTNRDAVSRGAMTAAAAQAGGIAVTGLRLISVLLSKFNNSGDAYWDAYTREIIRKYMESNQAPGYAAEFETSFAMAAFPERIDWEGSITRRPSHGWGSRRRRRPRAKR